VESVVKKRREIPRIALDSSLWSIWLAMRNDTRFRLLTHEEFAKLPTEEKFAYLARAIESPSGENQQPSQTRSKPKSARTAPKPKSARPLVQPGAATSGSE